MSRTIYLENGIIFTDASLPSFSTSLTIVDGKVSGINTKAPSGCERVDLKGQFAMPGFVDSHLHLVEGASGMGTINLRDVYSKENFCTILSDGVSKVKCGDWLIAFGWTQEKLGEMPGRHFFPEDIVVPILCYRADFHSAVLNDAALAQLPLDEIEPMTGGEAIRAGLVQEDALYHGVIPLMPEIKEDVKCASTLQALKMMQKDGITLVGSMEVIRDVESVLTKLNLPELIRIRTMLLDSPSEEVLLRCNAFQGDWLNVYGFKAFLDGSLGSRTAKMYDQWNDCEGNGVWAGLAATETLQSWVEDVVAMGFVPVMHAIGDEAVGKALQSIKGIDGSTRIEHAQCIADKDVPRLRGKMFAVQPLHQPGDAEIALKALGSKRATQLHNWRRMLDAGARLSFGSDWPIAEAKPLAAMQVAIAQGLSVNEAILSSTREAADSLGVPFSGSLQIGSYGDVVVLDKNPFDCDWINTPPSVTMTILDGNIVYKKEE